MSPAAAGEAFDWRVSVADVERDAPFSAFPGIDRTIVLLRGMGFFLRSQDGGLQHRLARYEPFSFSGDLPLDATLLGGPSTDFNVMVRRGRYRAEMTVLDGDARLPGGAAGLVFASEGVWQVEGSTSWAIGPWQGLLWREGRPTLILRPRTRVDSCLLAVNFFPLP